MRIISGVSNTQFLAETGEEFSLEVEADTAINPTVNRDDIAGWKYGGGWVPGIARYLIGSGVLQGNIAVYLLAIGDWNMDATSTTTVAHGLTDHTEIIACFGYVRNDTDTERHFISGNTGVSGQAPAVIETVDATNINLSRYTTGVFDNTNFDSTSYNRGHIVMWCMNYGE